MSKLKNRFDDAMPFAIEPVVYDFAINDSGTHAVLLEGDNALMPAKYYTLTVPDLLRYEAELNHILEDHPLTTVCQYDARRFDGALIMDMLSVHPMMIVRGQLVKNPSYVSPEIFLEEYSARCKDKDKQRTN